MKETQLLKEIRVNPASALRKLGRKLLVGMIRKDKISKMYRP